MFVFPFSVESQGSNVFSLSNMNPKGPLYLLEVFSVFSAHCCSATFGKKSPVGFSQGSSK